MMNITDMKQNACANNLNSNLTIISYIFQLSPFQTNFTIQTVISVSSLINPVRYTSVSRDLL